MMPAKRERACSCVGRDWGVARSGRVDARSDMLRIGMEAPQVAPK